MRYLLVYKPFGVLTQFTDRTVPPRPTLADYVPIPHVYSAGRLDADSEGLLLLTDDGRLKHRLMQPEFAHTRTYYVQVEGIPDDRALEELSAGVIVQGERTRPAEAKRIAEPALEPRVPPVRFRAAIPTSWISLTLTEGRNRQVRRMTAAVGFPTLRLVRWSMENLTIAGMTPGQWRDLSGPELRSLKKRL
jgi:23S rRNA pseudouridine2457 synthase